MLLDHFHSPLLETRPWTGFHGMWAAKLASAINEQLPEGWFAGPTVHWNIEINVAAFENASAESVAAKRPRVAAIPEPTKTIDFAFTTDVVEVQVFRELGELTLVGAVELVTPANKDRPESREAFVAKCDALLREQVGLAIVDVVTNRRGNLHFELLERWGESGDEEIDDLYLAAYRPFVGQSGAALSMWYRALRIGADLPSALLFLKQGPVVELPLEETYRETCAEFKIAVSGTDQEARNS